MAATEGIAENRVHRERAAALHRLRVQELANSLELRARQQQERVHEQSRPRRAQEEAMSRVDTLPVPREVADPSDIQHGGVPTMHRAAALGHLRYLHLHNDLDPLRFSIPDSDGYPPMYYAMKYNQYQAIVFLGQRYRDTSTLLTPRQIAALEQLDHGYLTLYLRGKQTIEEALDAIISTAGEMSTVGTSS